MFVVVVCQELFVCSE